jgi:DHA1 family bicyclomycin/chloramphenicol resistance-like MFS transporter
MPGKASACTTSIVCPIGTAPALFWSCPAVSAMTASMRIPFWLPLLLGFLTAVGPASTDMYLPAFPAIEASFHAPAGSAQYSLAAWFAGLAVGQITQGTLSDRLGRRLPLVASTALYTGTCVACALAPSILWLSAFRFLSAVAAAASMVIPRAVVRDLADGHQAAVLMSRLMLVMGAAPILAPSVGGAVLAFVNWRWIFWIMAGYGALALILVCLALPDTLPRERRVRLSLAEQSHRYRHILRERGFLTHSVLGGFSTFGFFAYLGGSSPVFIDGFGFTPAQYGVLFGACAVGLIGCSQVNAWLLPRVGGFALLRAVTLIDLAAAAALLAAALAGVHRLLAVLPPLFVFVSCQGFVNPNATVGALSRHAAHAGSASALMGMGQFVLGAISGLLVGVLTDGTPRGMAGLMLAGAAGMVAADLCRERAAVAPTRFGTDRSE